MICLNLDQNINLPLFLQAMNIIQIQRKSAKDVKKQGFLF